MSIKSYSEWLLFNTKSTIFQLYHGENMLHFNEMMSTLYYINMQSWILYNVVLDHFNKQSAGSHVAVLWHVKLILVNQSVFVMCLAKKQQIPISLSMVGPERGSNSWSTTLKASTLTITPPMQFYLSYKIYIKLITKKKVDNFKLSKKT